MLLEFLQNLFLPANRVKKLFLFQLCMLSALECLIAANSSSEVTPEQINEQCLGGWRLGGEEGGDEEKDQEYGDWQHDLVSFHTLIIPYKPLRWCLESFLAATKMQCRNFDRVEHPQTEADLGCRTPN